MAIPLEDATWRNSSVEPSRLADERGVSFVRTGRAEAGVVGRELGEGGMTTAMGGGELVRGPYEARAEPEVERWKGAPAFGSCCCTAEAGRMRSEGLFIAGMSFQWPVEEE